MNGTVSSALRPWPRADGDEETIKSILGRLQFERGHFRNITEETLEEEIATSGNSEPSSDTEAEDRQSENEDIKEPDNKTRQEELFAAKMEMLPLVATAQNEVLMALDFISLLASKDNPRAGELTMSPYLKSTIKAGTLAYDSCQKTNPLEKEEKQKDYQLAKGWRMEYLQDSANSLLKAATRLQDNVKRETKYWEQVLSISEKGWSVCRLPRERHNLGVRYGFSEALGPFQGSGMAALRSDDDGNIVLDKGLGDNPKSLRIRVQEGSRITGVSRMPTLAGEIGIESRIRHARDSLYEEELFHEVIRECRTLTSYGVLMDSSSIRLPMKLGNPEDDETSKQEVVIELVPLNEANELDTVADNDRLAQAIGLALRLLLSHTHRGRLAQRSLIPPPLSAAKRETPVANILRPVLVILHHKTVLDDLNIYLDRVTSALYAASVDFSVTKASFDFSAVTRVGSADGLLSYLAAPLRSTSLLSISIPQSDKEHLFGTEIYTSVAPPIFGSKITVTPPIDAQTADFVDIEAMAEHVDAAISSVLARAVVKHLPGWNINEKDAQLEKPQGLSGNSERVTISLKSGVVGAGKSDDGQLTLLLGKGSKEQWSGGRKEGRENFWQYAGKINDRKLASM